MKTIKIVAIALAAVGLLVAVYGVARPMSDYRKADELWKRASDADVALRRVEVDDDTRARVHAEYRQLSELRDATRARCQRIVQIAIVPIGLGLLLGIIALLRPPRGWMPLTSTLTSLLAGGLIGSMLAAGVF